MLTISKPLAAGQALRYHREEFANAKANYFTEDDRIHGEWQGRLAEAWSLVGDVHEEQFARLSQGQDPHTGVQLVAHRRSYSYQLENGNDVTSMEHRAGWDFTFSAPKSASVTALVGEDRRIVEAHKESVKVALDAVERYAQARLGGHHAPETTSQWIVAKFHHNTARPDQREHYAAPQLHTHSVVFNLTQRENGDVRAMDAIELFRSQQFGTAVYQAELGRRLRELGYEIEVGKNGAPEIRGYSEEYLAANSLRSGEIRAYLDAKGLEGAGAAQIAAHRTREAKNDCTSADVRELWVRRAAEYGDQHQDVMRQARERGPMVATQEHRDWAAERGMTYARDRNLERDAVVDERNLLRDTLRRGVGHTDLNTARQTLQIWRERGEFVDVARERFSSPSQRYTTPDMLRLEQENLRMIGEGRGQRWPIARVKPEAPELAHLNDSQRRAVEAILGSRDRVVGLQGDAGAGKTTTLATIREGAERAGYEVRGLAPTSRATRELHDAGVVSQTLQKHLAAGERVPTNPTFYIVDESSLASTRQMNTFLRRLGEGDRVLLVGDVKQHEGVEAGRPFAQAQDRGLQTARLDKIVRQQDESLRHTVERLANRDVREAVRLLEGQGRVKEIVDPTDRMRAIAEDYRRRPERTLVVSPDNASREVLNKSIRSGLQEDGVVERVGREVRVLAPRQDLTGADRRWAARYELGDAIRVSKGSRLLGIRSGEYLAVVAKDSETNTLKVQSEQGHHITYDPRRLQGVAVYRPQVRELAVGDRIQFTAPLPEIRVANREQGTIRRIDSSGSFQVQMDSGRRLTVDRGAVRHVDYGYAVTSYSSQGLTARRVLIHADTSQSRQLVNQRYAYVAVSRGSHDARVYTDNAQKLAVAFGREQSKAAALDEFNRHIEQQHEHSAHEHGRRV